MIWQDLVNLGRMLGIPHFLSEEGEKGVVQANKELTAAIRKYRKLRKENKDDSFTKVLHGQKVSEPTDPAYLQARQWITELRAEFKGYVIRRTGDSLDCQGSPISAMKKYAEHVILVDLYEQEYENLERIASELCAEKDAGMAFGLGRVSRKFLSSIGRPRLPSCTHNYMSRDMLSPQCLGRPGRPYSHLRQVWYQVCSTTEDRFSVAIAIFCPRRKAGVQDAHLRYQTLNHISLL